MLLRTGGPESDPFEGAPRWEDFILMIIGSHGLLYVRVFSTFGILCGTTGLGLRIEALSDTPGPGIGLFGRNLIKPSWCPFRKVGRGCLGRALRAKHQVPAGPPGCVLDSPLCRPLVTTPTHRFPV